MGISRGLAAAFAVMVIGGACSAEVSVGGASLIQEDIESEIIVGLTESVGVAPDSMDCEGISDIDVEEGNTFRCTGTAPNGDSFPVDVTLTNGEGGFTAVVPE